MKKLVFIIVLLIAFSGCLGKTDNKSDFNVVSNKVTIWEDSTGKYNIMLAFEVSNSRNNSLFFKESDFDIVDENGNLIETMKSVSAYPPIISSDETSVYYGGKISDKIPSDNISLKAIPHIEYEKSKAKRKEIGINGITGWRGNNAIGLITNGSSKIEYNNVHIAIITRLQNSNEVVSVRTAIVDSLKPGETLEFEAEDCIKQKLLNPNEMTKIQNFAYVIPVNE